MSDKQQQDRAGALIDKIQKDAQAEADVILANARGQAGVIISDARRNARLKVHDVIKVLRITETREMAHEAARFETERRQWRQSDEMEALAEGMTHLDAALTGLWQDKSSREQWCGNIINVAQQRLPAVQWQLEYPADLPEVELLDLTAKIATHIDSDPESSADPAMRGGLRISAGTAVVDGSITALLADRQNNSARFLSILLSIKNEDTP